jgi:tetratricopeptide (TPR) repeat protein
VARNDQVDAVPGTFRERPYHKTSPRLGTYNAPDPQYLPMLAEEWQEYAGREDIDPLWQTTILVIEAELRLFFEDANSRTVWALAPLVLYRKGVLSAPHLNFVELFREDKEPMDRCDEFIITYHFFVNHTRGENKMGILGRVAKALRGDPIAGTKEVIPHIDQENGKAKDLENLNRKGTALAKEGRYREAIACFDEMIALDPASAGAWNNKANSLANEGEYAKAIACYDAALQINPGASSVWNNKGVSLDNIEKHMEAVKCFDMAIQFDPSNFRAWMNKAHTLKHLGRNDESIRCYKEAKNLSAQRDLVNA